METSQALLAFAALSQETRLSIVRLLVQAGQSGLPAGDIAEAVHAAASTVSFHMKELERAGLVQSRREGRSIFYAARYAELAGLVRFLTNNCCAQDPDACREGPAGCCP